MPDSLLPELADDADPTAAERLWRAVLAGLLQDARRHWEGKPPYKPSIPPYEQEQAFDDLVACGPMTRHVCNFTGHDPEAVSDAFVRWCESGE